MSGKNRKLAIAWIAVILWMILIFALSAQPTEQTNKLSIGVTERIMSTQAAIDIENMHSTDVIVQQNTILRKLAHFLLYLVLGVLVSYALGKNGVKGYSVYLIAALICILYAGSDELHQMFVPGRNAAILDVLIDTAGSLVGIRAFGLLMRIQNKKHA